VLCVLVAVGLVGGAEADNSGNAHKCRQGGWQTWVSATGTSFSNQGDCVSYGAQGGTLKVPHVIAFTSPGASASGTSYLALSDISSGYAPTANATSGLPVVLTLDPASTGCSLVAGVVTFTGDGLCSIYANQSGNASWAPAPRARQSIRVYTAQTLVDLDQSTLADIGQEGGDVPLDPSVTAMLGDALTIAVTLGRLEVGVGLMAQDLGGTFTPSTGGAKARVDAINSELSAQDTELAAMQAVDPTTETLDQLQTNASDLQAYAAVLTQGFTDPGTVFTVHELFALINDAVQQVATKLQEVKSNATSVNIGDMFEMQMLMNPLGPLVEMANAIVSAANDAISSMCRNCKG
jgi:hypothetical protein